MIHTKLHNRMPIKKLYKVVFVHYNMRLRVRNLIYQCDNDDFYNPIDLNHIKWIRTEEQLILLPNNLDWLDEGISRGDEVMVMAVMTTVMMVTIMGATVVLTEGLIMFVKTNEVVLCHGI